ncbi:HesA/MoeB/ThiF family protein related to EC-YgdL [hydrothermal vent metagenome]|uniref:HesA/MoeB/ThiF family protein related to EC-YgdL n=1 Tax=hydrothermal vent metagenome TaxID=652676 RepID=A0A1W1CEP0_9ZZZZ
MSINITEEEFYKMLWFRSSMVFTDEEKELIKNARVGVIGVGGTGGICSEQLIRGGVGNITLVDPDIFEITNINRQHFCTLSTIGMKKVVVGKKRLEDINPFAKITIFDEGININNVRKIVSSLDFIVDASDNKSAHYPLHRLAKELKVPIISRAHTVPDFTFGAKANLWDYRDEGISTREEDENSPTASIPLKDITKEQFEAKDREVHNEFNRVYNKIFKSRYANKILLSENSPPADFFEKYKEGRDKLVEGTNWGPAVTITGTFFAIVIINLIIDSKNIFLGPISIKADAKFPGVIDQREIK